MGVSVFHDATNLLRMQQNERCCDSLVCKGFILQPKEDSMDVKLVIVALSVVFTVTCLFFGTKNGFYDSDDYHGNGSAH
jgi:hypothetical protein